MAKVSELSESLQKKHDEVVSLVVAFSKKYLNTDYEYRFRDCIVTIFCSLDTPLPEKGEARFWAAGICHAITSINNVFNASHTYHVKASELYTFFGVSANAALQRSKLIKETIRLEHDEHWYLSSSENQQDKLTSNRGKSPDTMTWLNDFLSDNQEGFREELEKHLNVLGIGTSDEPENKPAISDNGNLLTFRKKGEPRTVAQDIKIYRFSIFITQGIMSSDFIKQNPIVKRVIDIPETDRLSDFHEIIFKSFDRYDHHLYEFRYDDRSFLPKPEGFPMLSEEGDEFSESTFLRDLQMKVGDSMLYIFDFGDDWEHHISLDKIVEPEKGKKYPCVLKGEGKSPPQYIDEEDMI